MEALADSAMEIEAIHEGFVGSDHNNKSNFKLQELEKLAITETAGKNIDK